MKKFMEEFKAFAMRGNVLDMAVGVITGGHTDLSGLSFSLPGGGELMLGNFINAILNFLIMAFVVFCIVKAINNMHDKLSKPEPAAEPEPEKEPEPTKEELLLAEIRDLLKEQSK